MIVERFRHLMGQTFTIEPHAARDGWGEPTYGTAVSYRGRVVSKVQNVRDLQGNEVVSTSVVYVMSADVVSPLDRLTLSTGWVGSTEDARRRPAILATARYPGTRGEPCYTALFLQ